MYEIVFFAWLFYYIIPAKRYWHKIPWIAESTGFSKAPLVKKFSEKIIYKHLNLYEEDFRAIFDSYLERVIKRRT